jgi:hypothetical protein
MSNPSFLCRRARDCSNVRSRSQFRVHRLFRKLGRRLFRHYVGLAAAFGPQAQGKRSHSCGRPGTKSRAIFHFEFVLAALASREFFEYRGVALARLPGTPNLASTPGCAAEAGAWTGEIGVRATRGIGVAGTLPRPCRQERSRIREVWRFRDKDPSETCRFPVPPHMRAPALRAAPRALRPEARVRAEGKR